MWAKRSSDEWDNIVVRHVIIVLIKSLNVYACKWESSTRQCRAQRTQPLPNEECRKKKMVCNKWASSAVAIVYVVTDASVNFIQLNGHNKTAEKLANMLRCDAMRSIQKCADGKAFHIAIKGMIRWKRGGRPVKNRNYLNDVTRRERKERKEKKK